MDKINYIYKVFIIVFPDAETRIVREIYRTTSNQKAKMYQQVYQDFINEQSQVEVLGTRYDREDCLLTIHRYEDIDDLPF